MKLNRNTRNEKTLATPRLGKDLIGRALLLTLASTLLTTAADGDLDTAYGNSGTATASFGGSDNVYGARLQTDGKMIVVGGARPVSTEDFGVARFNADGTLDGSFGVNGKFSLEITAGASDRATGVDVQSDGKIIVGGYTRFASGNDNFAVIRLTSSGALDTTFGTGGITQIDFSGRTDRALTLKVAVDDRIVIGGWGSIDGMNLDFAVARLAEDGSLDTTFGVDGRVMIDVGDIQDSGNALLLQPDGKILIGGTAASGGGPFQMALLRLNTDGSLDPSFDNDGIFNQNFSGSTSDYINALALQPDGSILAAGMTTGSQNAFVARFTTTGSFDTTFNTIGYHIIDLGSTSDQFLALAVSSSGAILAGGQYVNGSALDSALVRLTSTGGLDAAFASGGKRLISLGANGDKIVGLGIQASGKIVAAIQTAASSGTEDFGVARFDYGIPNNAPTDILLTSVVVNQSGGANSVVGTLSAADADATDTHTYALVSGTGDTHNSLFNLSASALQANNSSTMAAGNYSIRIRTTDNASATYDEVFTIQVADDIAPVVTSVNVPANGTNIVGKDLTFFVNFSEVITVTGTPVLNLGIGSATIEAAYHSGSGSASLAFRHIVQAGEEDSDGVTVTGWSLSGGDLKDSAGNDATLALNSVGDTSGVKVDAVAPQITSILRKTPAEQTVDTATIVFEATFSEDVSGVSAASFNVAAVNGSTVLGTVTAVSGGPRVYEVTVHVTSGTGEFRLEAIE